MKTPFPAYYLEPERTPALPCVTVRPCLVTGLLNNAEPPSAIIRLHSLTADGWISRVVPFSALSSKLDAAIAIATDKIRALPSPAGLAPDLSAPAADEKSASETKAGASAGSLLPKP